ncbi:MAG TPA: hypothetical protein VF543_06975 [Pyrinomonadaceae bacterium]|jgi:hypothetical protein
MTKLKNLGVYVLPDGKELIAEIEPGLGYRLYPTKLWHQYRSSEYLVTREGRLLIKGKPSNLSVEHLIDTGRRAEYPKSSKLL